MNAPRRSVTRPAGSRWGTEALDLVRARLAPLARRGAYSWWVAAGLIAFTTAKQLVHDARVFGGPPLGWVAASLLSAVAFLVVFGVVRALIRRAARPSLIAVVVGYTIAAATRALSLGLAAAALGIVSDPSLLERLTSVASNVAILVLLGDAAGRYEIHRDVVGALEQERSRLVAMERSLRTGIERTYAELAAGARAAIDPALRALDVAIAQGPEAMRTGEAVEALERLIDDEVRPLGRRLAADDLPDPLGPLPGTSGERPAGRVPFPQRFALADGIHPRLSAAVVFLIALPSAIRELTPGEAALYLGLAIALPLAVFVSVRRLTAGVVLPSPVGVALLAAIHGAIAAIGLPLVAWAGIRTPPAIGIAGTISFAGLGAAIAVASLVEIRRAESERELGEVVARLELATGLLRRRDRTARRRLARLLHGRLQGELHAAAIRLRSSAEPSEADLEEVRAAIGSAIGLLAATEPDRGRTRACLDALAATWSDLRTIDAVLAPGVAEALDMDPDADEAVAEIVAEATNNAIRHGDARTVTIRIGWTDETAGSPGTLAALIVRVEDDGSGWEGDPAPGMGTRTFDELFARWDRARTAGGTVVTGSVPVDLSGPAAAAPSA